MHANSKVLNLLDYLPLNQAHYMGNVPVVIYFELKVITFLPVKHHMQCFTV
jgi:hypothetical protein